MHRNRAAALVVALFAVSLMATATAQAELPKLSQADAALHGQGAVARVRRRV
jgi:hypothetical protein